MWNLAPKQKAMVLKWAESNGKILSTLKKYYGFSKQNYRFSVIFPLKNNFLENLWE